MPAKQVHFALNINKIHTHAQRKECCFFDAAAAAVVPSVYEWCGLRLSISFAITLSFSLFLSLSSCRYLTCSHCVHKIHMLNAACCAAYAKPKYGLHDFILKLIIIIYMAHIEYNRLFVTICLAGTDKSDNHRKMTKHSDDNSKNPQTMEIRKLLILSFCLSLPFSFALSLEFDSSM